jgi:hypothetical protein
MKTNRVQVTAIVALGLALCVLSRAQAQPGTEPPGIHGMLVFGAEKIYVSHLPMFVPQHRYQGIWEVTFGEQGDKSYRAEQARQDNAGRLFTLAPKELFLLPDLTGARKSFRADVFVGHFEREATTPRRILSNVTVKLKDQVHFHPFRVTHRRPDSLTYVLFSAGKEVFLAHWISTAPNYDQVLAVTSETALDATSRARQLTLQGRSDDEALRPGESPSGLLVISGDPELPVETRPVAFRVTSEIYLERDELKASGIAHEH